MKKYIIFIVSFFVFTTLTGCASHDILLSQASKNSIHTVSIDPNVTAPTSANYSGPPAARAISGMGLIGFGLSCAMTMPGEHKIEQSIRNCNIQLNELLYQNFKADLHRQTNLKFTSSDRWDAQFKLGVVSYGFSDRVQSPKGTLPFVDVTGKLVDQQGNIVWQVSKEVYLNDEAYSRYQLNDYVNNNELMEKAFHTLMLRASDDLVSTLNN
jgi:hypothetical protein